MGLFYVWSPLALHVIVSHVYSAECSDYVVVVDVKLDIGHWSWKNHLWADLSF